MCQLELFEKLLTIKIINEKGLQIFYLAPCDAVDFIIVQSQKLKLWLYVDGVQRNPNNFDGGMLSNAKEIMLLRPLVGG